MKEFRVKFENLVYSLAMQESARSGKDYTECISKASDEACIRLGISIDRFIKMFL